MTIDRVSYINHIQQGKNAGGNNQVNRTEKTDSIAISQEALAKLELKQANDVAFSAPDVRADRIAELKLKINDPSYINDVILNATADKIMDALGI